MKNFKIWATALLAVLGFASCSEDCDHDFIEYDYSKELVGTWTCLEEGFAEAWVIGADGSVVSTGIEDGEYWEEVKGTLKVKNNKMTVTFEDNDNFEGSFDLVPGETLSIVDGKTGERNTYYYCEEDLSKEIVGMWVCNDGTALVEDGMAIQTFMDNGKTYLTTGTSVLTGNQVVNGDVDYKIIGDLMFHTAPKEAVAEGVSPVLVTYLMYIPNGNSLGDMLYLKVFLPVNGKFEETTSSWLRVKQDLNLVGKKYSYNNVYISNVKGSDKEINFMGYKFAFANMDGSRLEMVMKSALFGIEFPDANTVSYTYQLNGISETYTLPIVVEGNKMTFKVSEKVPSLKDVVFYAFQDADDSQMHLYIHQSSFVSFFTNMQAIMAVAVDPAFDITNPAAIDAIYNEIDAAVESINLSVVMK